MKLSSKKFNTINVFLPETIDWLVKFGYVYNSYKNVGEKRKYVVSDGAAMEYYFSDTTHLDKKHFVSDKIDDKYKIMISFGGKTSMYKCYKNKNGNIYIADTITDKKPRGYKKCNFADVLDYCTQMSLTLL